MKSGRHKRSKMTSNKKVFSIIMITVMILMVILPLTAFAAYSATTGYTLVDDKDSSVTYSGTGWVNDTGVTNAINGDAKYSYTTNDYVQFTYTGGNVNLNLVTSNTGGIATVIIDGTSYNVDTYSSTTNSGYKYSSSGLAMGMHTVKIIVSGTKNASSTRYDVEFGGYEYQIRPSITPVMTSNTTPSGVVTSSTPYNTNYSAWHAFDNSYIDAGTFMLAASTGTLGYQFTSSKIVGGYGIAARAGGTSSNQQAPKSWTFEGSNDGASWTVLDTQTNISFTGDTQIKQFNLTYNANYVYYRWNFTANNGAANLSLSEAYIYAGTADTTPPANPTSLSVTNITKSTSTLHFTTPTDTDYDKYKIYRNSTLINTSASGQPKNSVLTFNDSGLTAGTTYTYKVTSVDTTGNESTGSTVNFTTIPLDSNPPSQITDLRATPYDGHTVLNWSASIDPEGSAVTYDVFIDGVKVTTTKLTVLTYDATVSNNANHSYYVVAYDDSLNASPASNTVTTYFDTISPLAPIGLMINGKSSDIGNSPQLTLSWTANTEPDLAGYNVYQMPSTKLNATLLTATMYTVTGLTTNMTYSYAVTAVDTSNNESVKSATVSYTFDNVAPINVTGLSVTGGDKTANINFTASTSTDVVGYKIYRNSVYLTTITGTSYQDKGLTNGTSYSYSVSSIDAAGNESSRSSEIAVVPNIPPSPPLPPTNLSISVRNGAILMNWSPSLTATGYNIYLNGIKVNTSPIISTSYEATGLDNGTTYTVVVTAINSVGESSNSNAQTGTPSVKSLPYITFVYSLKDVVDGVSSWFASYWLILAFTIAIPLSFYVGRKIKQIIV